MDDLRSRAAAFVRGPCILSVPWLLLTWHADGESWADPKLVPLLGWCIRETRDRAARYDGDVSGPGSDARNWFNAAAALLEEILVAVHPPAREQLARSRSSTAPGAPSEE